ncbi:MAG: glycosyltransferase family 2 protein [Acidimicrobiales bacterium]
MNADVSVVIPTRDRAALLVRTLRSVFAQRDVEVEVVVVDDGSRDDISAVVRGAGDGRVRLLRQERSQGVSAARNRGIDVSTGSWVAFLDDDDLWSPDKLRAQLDAAEAGGSRWSIAGTVNVDSDLRITGGGPPPSADEIARNLPLRNTVVAGASNVIVRCDLLDRAGRFDASLRHMADWDLWLRLGRAGAPAVVCRPLVAYGLHATNASLDWPEIPAELDVLEARYADERRGQPVDRAYVYRWLAWNALRAGSRRRTLRWYAAAARSGDLHSVGRAAVAMVRPSLAAGRAARANTAWYAEARQWLAELEP